MWRHGNTNDSSGHTSLITCIEVFVQLFFFFEIQGTIIFLGHFRAQFFSRILRAQFIYRCREVRTRTSNRLALNLLVKIILHISGTKGVQVPIPLAKAGPSVGGALQSQRV